ncbi:MAG: fibronectin type III domain-containing protein [Flavobacteriales bacterium]|nr:fibronectin type III domain-containing protein [Flavobacteriales bacterium]
MKMIKAGTTGLNAEALIAKAEYVEGMMASNANFPTPNPSIATVTAAREALVAAVAQAESRAIADIAVRNALTSVLREHLVNLARYVNNVAGGDVEKALSSGFELAKRPEPSTKLEAPMGLEVRLSDFEGCLNLNWKPVEDARMYQVYMCEGDPSDPKAVWTVVAVSSRTRTRISELTPGQFYSFRVTALGRVGEGPASEVSGRRAA